MNLLFAIILAVQIPNCSQQDVQYVDWAEENLTVTDSTFNRIQDKIYGAFIASFGQRKPDPIDEIISQIKNSKAKVANLSEYWIAYAQYYRSIHFIKFGKKDECEKAVREGIAILDDKKNKNAEDLALLALLQSFSIQFESGINAGIVSNRAKANAAKAIELDPSNLRAHYVSGSLDYYTPAQYGGGKKVEGFLRKAVKLPDQKTKNPYLPSWGKEEAYSMLIEHLLNENNKTEAMAFYKEGIKLFPESYQLGELAKKLI